MTTTLMAPSTPSPARSGVRADRRRLVLVDLENVVRGGVSTPQLARTGRAIIESQVGVGEHEQVVVATDVTGVFNARTAWSGARLRIGTGPDGADRALLEVLDEGLPERFDELVLVSGDGIFADPVGRLVRRGLPVRVAAWSWSLSRRLRRAASETILLDPWFVTDAPGVPTLA
ncbi:NYN domain-containing protein [Georgenia sp. Z1491]|uniref:NYN domain-containing protein n=1 Tax=Georgenia sp. Z1491 TaxID=3416707 RepID=UPI003CEAA19F